jgi:hypothetical protein
VAKIKDIDMTLTIDVPPDLAQALEEKAKQAGLSVAEVAVACLVQAARMNREGNQPADITARLAALKQLGSYDTRARAGLPPLSDEDISRESIYERRGL